MTKKFEKQNSTCTSLPTKKTLIWAESKYFIQLIDGNKKNYWAGPQFTQPYTLLCSVFFSFQFCDVTKTGDHWRENLA